jgi:exodeoxyribonuclease-3
MAKIISYNVNGIRAALKKGLLDWIGKNDYDIIGFQETKAQPDQIDEDPFKELGYECFWHSAEKKGYSGVLTLSKLPVEEFFAETGMSDYDREGRFMHTLIDGILFINTYFPSGSSGDERQAFKMEFLDDYFNYLNGLKGKYESIVVLGDYNICHKEIDIHNPVSNKDTSGFKPEERAWMSKFFDSGFVDTFREFHPEADRYSWWSFRANARANNKGWRIDYINTTENLKSNLLDADIFDQVKHSDHCPIYLEMKLK